MAGNFETGLSYGVLFVGMLTISGVNRSTATELERLEQQVGRSLDDQQLVAICRDKTQPTRRRVQAARALGELGKAAEAVGEATEPLLRDSDKEVVAAIARTLGRIGVRPEIAATLRDLLTHDDQSIRLSALEALGRQGRTDNEAAVLVVHMELPSRASDAVRYIQGLASVGRGSACAIKRLGEIGANDELPEYCRLAAMTGILNGKVDLGKVDGIRLIAHAQSLSGPQLTEIQQRDEDAACRVFISHGVLCRVSDAPESWALLRQSIGDEHFSDRLRSSAIQAYLAAGGDVASILPSLSSIIKDFSDGNVAHHSLALTAIEACERATELPESELLAIAQCVRDDGSLHSRRALGVLGSLGKGAVAALPMVQDTLGTTEQPDLQLLGGVAIWKCGGDLKLAKQLVLSAVEDKRRAGNPAGGTRNRSRRALIRAQAIDMLVEMGLDDDSLAVVRQFAHDDWGIVRQSVIRAMLAEMRKGK